MIPDLFLNIEDMEPRTPQGIKILITNVRKRVEDLRKYVDINLRQGKVNL
jgi:hypothetical protein